MYVRFRIYSSEALSWKGNEQGEGGGLQRVTGLLQLQLTQLPSKLLPAQPNWTKVRKRKLNGPTLNSSWAVAIAAGAAVQCTFVAYASTSEGGLNSFRGGRWFTLLIILKIISGALQFELEYEMQPNDAESVWKNNKPSIEGEVRA